MYNFQSAKVLVVGLATSGLAACKALRHNGASVVAIDGARSAELERTGLMLTESGVKVQLGASLPQAWDFDLVVVSPGVPTDFPAVVKAREIGLTVIGEFELGYQLCRCLNISITGTNGKTTTTELIDRVLRHCGRSSVAAGNIGLPFCDVAELSKNLDFVTLEVSSFQLETTQFFRPSVAVLLNITPDHLDRYPGGMREYALAKARIFANQQPFDWAIVQLEALEQLQAYGFEIPCKVITFSARRKDADLILDRGLLISRLPEWTGPVLNMDLCKISGPHNAENLMAVLAIGRVLRLPLESVAKALWSYEPAPHRCELVAEIDGVKFINDSKATNVDAVRQALETVSSASDRLPNIWLIAGGKDKGFDFHEVGPLISARVKGAFLIGEAREKIRSAWSLFTPCTTAASLLEAVAEAAHRASAGDVVLLSPACSSFDQFRNYQHRGEVFRDAVRRLDRNDVGSAERESKNETELCYT